MNNAITSVTQKINPSVNLFYVTRVKLLSTTLETGYNINELSNIVHHEQGFRTVLSNIKIDFYPSKLLKIDHEYNNPYGYIVDYHPQIEKKLIANGILNKNDDGIDTYYLNQFLNKHNKK
jgi:hypothetical protein